MTTKAKSVARFKSEAEERALWEARDSSDLVDWSKAQRASRRI